MESRTETLVVDPDLEATHSQECRCGRKILKPRHLCLSRSRCAADPYERRVALLTA